MHATSLMRYQIAAILTAVCLTAVTFYKLRRLLVAELGLDRRQFVTQVLRIHTGFNLGAARFIRYPATVWTRFGGS